MNGTGRLTGLVRPLLVAAPAGRIASVVSEDYGRELDLGNLQGERQHSYVGACSASELGKVLFTTELAGRINATPADQAAGGIAWAAVQQPDHLRRGDRLGEPCRERKPLSRPPG